MARIKIKRSADTVVHVHVVGVAEAKIPVDNEFHDCDDALLGALDDSDVEYEIENVAAGSSEPDPAAGGTDGLGGSPVPLPLTDGETPEDDGGDAHEPEELVEERDAPPAAASVTGPGGPPQAGDPLDHDGNGKKGGSKPRAKRAAK